MSEDSLTLHKEEHARKLSLYKEARAAHKANKITAPKPDKVIEDELPPPLNPAIQAFNGLALDIKKSHITNHQRLMHMDQLLYAVVQHANDHGGPDFWHLDNSPFCRLLHSILNDELMLCVAPFNLLNSKGDVSLFYQKFPRLIKLISVGRKPKIVQACFFLLGQLIHIIVDRPDILRQMFVMGPYMNEVIIEYHNSTIARRIQHLELLFQNIRTESVNTGKMREFFMQMKKALELVLSDSPELVDTPMAG